VDFGKKYYTLDYNDPSLERAGVEIGNGLALVGLRRPGAGKVDHVMGVAGGLHRAGRDQKAPARRLRLEALASAAGAHLERFITTNAAEPATITTDGWRGYAGLEAAAYRHRATVPSPSTAPGSETDQGLPAVHPFFGLVQRWPWGTHTVPSAPSTFRPTAASTS